MDKNFKWFLPFLIFVVIYEFVNMYNWMLLHNSNAWCNNLEGILELTLYGLFIASLHKKKAYRNRVYMVTLAGALLSLIDIVFIQGFWKLATIAMLIQNSILVVLVCIYFYSLFNDDDENLNLITHPPFLVATGILFTSLGCFFYYATFSYMIYRNNYHFYILAKVLPSISSLIFNSLLTFAFICFARAKKAL
ncbi:hypothetical protein [Mucilaginibacter sp. SP1R1]|uniref:hypothetical protein n=1 Tax=Mucilaginibacter sp. SP1R1 TaxID=2723091 RepID=UPI0016116E63|nr:hypothetical protein [Mucilaginibacter sp. SP1R1]MBB6150109.1 hypothetical protein [Mucilaginibacter sp. SP1R1]